MANAGKGLAVLINDKRHKNMQYRMNCACCDPPIPKEDGDAGKNLIATGCASVFWQLWID